MLKIISRRQPWICSRCLKELRRKRTYEGKRYLSRLATIQPSGIHHRTGVANDDRTLRDIFDSQPFWKEFSATKSGGPRAGLLQNKYLSNPQGFCEFTEDALQKCQRIVARVLAAKEEGEYRSVARDLDQLSDQLCRVIDLVEFIRNVHPDERIQHAAAVAHAEMFQYMNVLNTTQGLSDQLEKAHNLIKVRESWSEEEKVTADILMKDFSHSAIDGPLERRKRFVQLASEIAETGQALTDEMVPEQLNARYSSNKLKGMDPTVVKDLTSWGTTSIPTNSFYANLALRTVEDPEIRKDLYVKNRTASKKSIERVEQLVRARAELAQLSGHASFAHLALSGKMAKTPEAVNQFLEALAADNKSQVQSDLNEILAIKRSDNLPNQMNAWDREYYSNRLRTNLYANSQTHDTLSSYFSLGTVMQGLSRLFYRLYGIRLVPAPTHPGETWNSDVRRLDVLDDTEGHIAVIYCDLFSRPNKSPNPAHFTLRCSREISDHELASAAPSLPTNPNLSDLSSALNDGMALNVSPYTKTLHQLPTIGFICDFPRPQTRSQYHHQQQPPTLLTFRQLSTLFHEMGHCLHSILGRTSLQNVSGTRCATDFAELPSILMEHFAADPGVLSLYARHWETGAPLDTSLVAAEISKSRRVLGAAETESQILLSVLDQRLHDGNVPHPGRADAWDSTQVYHSTFADPRFASVLEPRGTSWHAFFGHLHQYGAVYYSYLFDRAIAGRVWRDVFSAQPSLPSGGGSSFTSRMRGAKEGAPRALDREAGQIYREEVLRWGGGRDPWRCVAGVLGRAATAGNRKKRGGDWGWMAEGGKEAMREVGRWGAGDKGF